MFGDITRDEVFRIETRRLWLRWPSAGDASAVEALASRIEVAGMTSSVPHPYPPGEAQRYVAQARSNNGLGDGLFLVMTEKHGARALTGIVSLDSRVLSKAWIGYMLDPCFWGRGYATEATQAMVEMAFRLTGSRAVVSSVTADNTASMRVLKKCGFVSIGPDKQNAPARGGMIAVERFSLSRKLWQAERAQPVRDLSHCPA